MRLDRRQFIRWLEDAVRLPSLLGDIASQPGPGG
jgi:hypothetical protein